MKFRQTQNQISQLLNLAYSDIGALEQLFMQICAQMETDDDGGTKSGEGRP